MCAQLIAQSSPTLCDRILCPWECPGKNTGVGCHFLLQGGLPNPGIKFTSPALAGGFFTTLPLCHLGSFNNLYNSL